MLSSQDPHIGPIVSISQGSHLTLVLVNSCFVHFPQSHAQVPPSNPSSAAPSRLFSPLPVPQDDCDFLSSCGAYVDYSADRTVTAEEVKSVYGPIEAEDREKGSFRYELPVNGVTRDRP